MIALMADGAAKEMAKLNLLYNQKVRAAQGNAEKLLAIQKWYEREEMCIRDRLRRAERGANQHYRRTIHAGANGGNRTGHRANVTS